MASKLFITPLKGANKQDWHLQNKALATKKTEQFSLGVQETKERVWNNVSKTKNGVANGLGKIF